ncbi:MAG: histidinol dehydrogenase [Deferribacteraceae bacterium]|jgi:histidinol dehydrogenase|nr:histidinol dehydrogenase [Deferribacteraceae bacterium]
MIISRQSDKFKQILSRGSVFEGEYLPAVLEILDNVKKNGDRAVIDYTKRFDRFTLTAESMLVTQDELDKAHSNCGCIAELDLAAWRIRQFHERQREASWSYEDGSVMLGQKITPLDRVGVYVPGGKAAYPSSVLMNVIPAMVAGVKEIIIVSPTPDGIVNPSVLVAANLVGIDKIYRIGGAQAVAALAYGTETIPRVDKIVGPGNIYVALAKKMVFGTVDIDMIAGPSEILVIADESANPEWVAADMLSQAEHDELASAIAICTSDSLAKAIEAEFKAQLAKLTRKEIAAKSAEKYCAIIVAKDLDEAANIANDIAPEHLELCVTSPMELMRKIRHAGAIFMGHHTPEAAGDYLAGPNHVLPTGGTARFFSPLGVYDFVKRSSLIYYSPEAIKAQANAIATLAKLEGLQAHAKSAMLRK